MENHNLWVGERIRLRAAEPGDAGDFFKWSADYDTESDRCCDVVHFPRSFGAMTAHVEALSKQEPENDGFFWIMENEQGESAGCINTFGCDRRVGAFSYGLGVRREFRGRGYAKEAVRLVLRYYFQELNYQKATVRVYSFNARSLGLHRALGFTQEGVLRRTAFTAGRLYDEVVFGMTREEFDARFGAEPEPQ